MNNTNISNSKSYKTLILLFGQGFNAMVSFLFFPYLARVLSMESYGTYGQVVLITELVKSFFIMGLTNIIYVQLSDKTKKTSTVLKSNLLFSFFSGITGASLVFISSDYIGHFFNNISLIYFIKVLSISLIFQIPADYLNAILIYSNKIKQSVFITVLTNLIKVLLLYFSIHYWGAMQMIFVTLVFTSILQFFCMIFVIPKNYFSGGIIDIRIMRSQFLLSLPLIMSGLFGQLLKFSDGLMVSALLSVKEYAIFRNGAFEIPIISVVYSSVSSILLPEISTLSAENNTSEIIKLKRNAASSVAILTMPIAVFVLLYSTPLITFLFGDSYANSAPVFFIINLLVLIRINDYQDIMIIRAASKYILIYNILCLALNLILGYIFIAYFGLIGAALGTTISIYIFALLLLKKSTKLIGASLFQFFDKNILLTVFLTSLITGLVLYIPFYYFSNKILVLPIGFVYIAIVYFIFHKKQLFKLSLVQAIFRF